MFNFAKDEPPSKIYCTELKFSTLKFLLIGWQTLMSNKPSGTQVRLLGTQNPARTSAVYLNNSGGAKYLYSIIPRTSTVE